MENHKYEFRRYANIRSKGKCPKCGDKHSFVYYVYRGTDKIVRWDIGKCDHETGCGYHAKPWKLTKEEQAEAMKDNGINDEHIINVPEWKPMPLIPIPSTYLKASRIFNDGRMRECNFTRFFLMHEGIDPIKFAEAMIIYHIGMTREGDVIFWQVDTDNKIHTGKCMRYLENGHRDKSDFGTWIHKKLQAIGEIPLTYEIRGNQCLFGLHLLRREENKDKPVCIVESEKTAVICSMFKPQYVWMACGGLKHLNDSMLKPLIDTRRKIILMPDRDGFKDWSAKRDQLNSLTRSCVSVSRWVQQHAIETDGRTADILDILLRILKESRLSLNDVERYLNLTEPCKPLRQLIETFELTPVHQICQYQ